MIFKKLFIKYYPNDFELRNTQEALKENDAYAADAKYIMLTAQDVVIITASYGIAAGCIMGCLTLITEAGDQLASGICFIACGALGMRAGYKSFRRGWQIVSIPVKEFCVNLCCWGRRK
jgi:hypothetical protein